MVKIIAVEKKVCEWKDDSFLEIFFKKLGPWVLLNHWNRNNFLNFGMNFRYCNNLRSLSEILFFLMTLCVAENNIINCKIIMLPFMLKGYIFSSYSKLRCIYHIGRKHSNLLSLGPFFIFSFFLPFVFFLLSFRYTYFWM